MKGERLTAPKGMNDILPGAAEPFLDTALWDHISMTAARLLESYGYRHVRLPIVEETPLFARGIGEATDIVSKEMYSFTDRGERSLTLRPEGTAGVVRAYVEHGLGGTVQRWWYGGPMFRAERPQKGRYRQFYQIGAELLGPAEPAADAEMIGMVWRLCQELGVPSVTPRVNCLGDAASRRAYREVLGAYLKAHAGALCESCRERIDTNPLRALDCKREGCRAVVAGAPDVLSSLTPEARAHFDAVLELLAAAKVPVQRDPRLVRGLDYYTGTLFELTTSALGAQDAVLGGGRYDELVAELGGPPTPALGFAAGVERLALLVAEAFAGQRRGPDLYLVPMGGGAGPEGAAAGKATALAAVRLADECRGAGLKVEVDVAGGKVKAQMRRADKSGARFALVLGENEAKLGRGLLKDLGVSSETEVELKGAALAAAVRQVAPRPTS